MQLDLLRALGDQAAAQRQVQWLQRHTGLAFAEDIGDYALMPLNVLDAQRLARPRATATEKGVPAVP